MINLTLLKCPIFLCFVNLVYCSIGDNSPFYKSCVNKCKTERCDEDQTTVKFSLLNFPLWSCLENCEYECQWETVEAFQRKNWSVPQFKGKWPFIRLFGFQEPASVFFSMINLAVGFKGLNHFRKTVPRSTPFYYVWTTFICLQINCWIWSIVYHSRDTDITERLDYMSAFTVILYSFYGVGLRYLNAFYNKLFFFWSTFCLLLEINHLAYLWFYKFDYGYNMKLNCIVGGITLLLWILWSFLHYNSQPFVWKIFVFAILMGSSMLLEVADFPPLFWIFDAHSLWHSTSIPVSTLLYSFLVDDCTHLVYADKEKILLFHKKH